MGRATDFLKHCGLLYENISQKSLRHFTHPSLGFKEWTESNLDVSEPKFKDRKEVGVTGKPGFKGAVSSEGGGVRLCLLQGKSLADRVVGMPAQWGFPPHLLGKPFPPLPSFLDI